MKIKKRRIFIFFLFICIFCLAYLYVKSPVNAQYPVNNYKNYYEYPTQTVAPSYLYNTAYANNYSWSMTKYFGRETAIPTPKINDWTVHPAFGNTVYAVTTEGNSLTIYGTYFSAHTHAGVNFNRTLSMMGSSLYSMPNQTMYQNIGGQSSFISPINYYARQVLQFSPVLHGPILNY
jgi:hypothetical protein